MKNIILNSNQVALIKEAIERQKNEIGSLPIKLLRDINDNNTPLSNCKHSDKYLKKMVKDSMTDAISEFNDDITKYDYNTILNKLQKLIAICQKKEEPIKTELEKLCSDLVLSSFELNGKDIELECNLINEIPNTKQFHVKSDMGDYFEYDSLDSIDELDIEKTKRKIINTLVMGASMKLTNDLLKEALDEIFELDEDLPHLYNKIIKINKYLLFLTNDEISDKNNMQGAYEDITLSKLDNKVKVKSEGIIFPFLLTETIRGFIEILSSETLPNDESNMKLVLDSCDLLKDEPWYMILGETLWDKVTLGDKLEPKEYEHYFMKLFELETNEFVNLMSEVFANTFLGREEIEKLFSKIKYDYDYKSFEKDLDKKRKESNIIEDEYLREEELNDGFFFRK